MTPAERKLLLAMVRQLRRSGMPALADACLFAAFAADARADGAHEDADLAAEAAAAALADATADARKGKRP